MNVLFVLENYIPHIGGVEVVFKNLCEGLIKLGHDVSIVTHRIKGTKKFEIINGVNVHRVNCFHSRYWFSFLSIFKAIKLAKQNDIIHTTTYNGALPARIASIFSGKKCVITVHEVLKEHWKNFDLNFISRMIHRFLERMIMKLKFDKFICVSKSTNGQVLREGINDDKVVVVYNGVDYDFWNPKKYDGKEVREKLGVSDNFVYFFYGRPGITKGFEYLIRAVPMISVPNAKLVAIVSKDKAYDKRYSYIMKLIKKLGISDKVIILDPVGYKELPNYVKAADCVVVPSLTEGFGFTTAESCALGKPVVVSNTTSLPEVVSGKYVLVKPKSAEAIAKGIEMIYNNQGMKKGLKKFLLEDNINNYLKVYQELI